MVAGISKIFVIFFKSDVGLTKNTTFRVSFLRNISVKCKLRRITDSLFQIDD
jgi:hypothetical protein